MPLTDVQVRQLSPTDRVQRLWDGGGLHVECRPGGSKLWILKYYASGRERRISLGPYPAISLREARLKREELRRQIREGLDPSQERKRAKVERRLATGGTVRAVVDEWLQEHGSGWTSGYLEDTRRAFDLHVLPRIGERPIGDVHPAELLDLLRSLTASGKRRETVRRLRQKLEAVWNLAVLTGRASSNAAAPLKGLLAAPVVQSFAAVPERNLGALLAALRTYGNPFVETAVRLQLLTACRPGEARKARWNEFDLAAGVWTIPAARMKARRDHVVPMPRQAQAALISIQPLTGHGSLVFPSRSKPSEPMSDGTVNKAFARCGFPGVTAHGFRSLFSTAAHEAGQRSDVIEACLAHVDPNRVRGTYNRATHLAARRELLQWWADRIDAQSLS